MREEHRAYSLLGLFGVYMLRYLERRGNAFIRLQIEIMKSFNDQSIFVWKTDRGDTCGLLASSPDDFAESVEFRIPSDLFRSIFQAQPHPSDISIR